MISYQICMILMQIWRISSFGDPQTDVSKAMSQHWFLRMFQSSGSKLQNLGVQRVLGVKCSSILHDDFVPKRVF